MIFNTNKHKEDLLFIPLGGANEIGMNLNMYHWEGKWLIADMGIGFADAEIPGVDILLPKIDFAIKVRKNIAGLVLTHAHEDHIGAVQYLWEELKCPIFTTPFTANVLKMKLSEFIFSQEVKINEIKPNSELQIGPFGLEMAEITHSVLEMNALLIKTKKGNIFHTGDWKLDHSPVVGDATDEERLKKIGNQGVLAMVGDSTNIFNPGHSGSEGDLQESLHKLIAPYSKGLIVITTFASNVARLYSIAKVAQKANRKVVLAGRSLWRMYTAAKDSGYLDDIPEFLNEKAMKNFKKEELLIICTGCQGEALAATKKIADKKHPQIAITKGDVIIFSSKIIPGNERKIYSLFNQFCKLGVEVLTEKDHFVHVSGHPSQQEVAKMYELIKPKVAIPVHGESIHLHEHCKFARAKGIKQAIEVENGDVVLLDEKSTQKIAKVDSGYLAVDGNSIININSKILKVRSRLAKNGAALVTIFLNKDGGILGEITINTPGLLDEHEDRDIIDSLNQDIVNIIGNSTKIKIDKLRQSITSFLRKFFKQTINKEPEVIVNLERA